MSSIQNNKQIPKAQMRPSSARDKASSKQNIKSSQTASTASTMSQASSRSKSTLSKGKELPKGTGEEGKKEKKPKKSPVSLLAPRNLEEEQRKFFESGCTYNPQLKYKDPDAIPEILAAYKPPEERYVQNAIYILQQAKDHFGGGEQIQTEIDGGKTMNYEETVYYFNEYLLNLRIEHLVHLKFSEKAVARTSCKYNPKTGQSTITIALPVQYRINQINGVMNHEIGTHFLRKFNDKKQIWYKGRQK